MKKSTGHTDESSTALTTQDTQVRTVEPVSVLTPASVVGVSTQLDIAQELLPEEFRGVELEVIETGFSPTVKWVTPGNYVAGIYTDLEEGVGPNGSRLYNFTTKAGKKFGLWGTTVLDRAFDSGLKAGTIAPGRIMMITFMGEVTTDKQPCKLFHVAIAKVKASS